MLQNLEKSHIRELVSNKTVKVQKIRYKKQYMLHALF